MFEKDVISKLSKTEFENTDECKQFESDVILQGYGASNEHFENIQGAFWMLEMKDEKWNNKN